MSTTTFPTTTTPWKSTPWMSTTTLPSANTPWKFSTAATTVMLKTIPSAITSATTTIPISTITAQTTKSTSTTTSTTTKSTSLTSLTTPTKAPMITTTRIKAPAPTIKVDSASTAYRISPAPMTFVEAFASTIVFPNQQLRKCASRTFLLGISKCCSKRARSLVSYTFEKTCNVKQGTLNAFNVFSLKKQQNVFNTAPNLILFQSSNIQKDFVKNACFVNCYLISKGVMSPEYVIDQAKLTNFLAASQTDATWKSSISSAVSSCISTVESLKLPNFVTSKSSTCPGKAFLTVQCVLLELINRCPNKVVSRKCDKKYTLFSNCYGNILSRNAQEGGKKQKNVKNVEKVQKNQDKVNEKNLPNDENNKKGKKNYNKKGKGERLSKKKKGLRRQKGGEQIGGGKVEKKEEPKNVKNDKFKKKRKINKGEMVLIQDPNEQL
ncbi:uncharacterized protein LOC132195314 [Neocloeon triangulifer]|uniref:uncharacterized protein LOC132195314 n=1 Tax=Neocloeon triangulifer TaxID=2078957 RepID=UPI00286F1F95|nr:uncharacterized protein LOC132195314 [Neocloeon triangulifer]